MDKCRKRPDSRPLVASSRQSTPAYQDPSFLQLGLRPFPACSSTQRRENWGAQKAKIKKQKNKKNIKINSRKKKLQNWKISKSCLLVHTDSWTHPFLSFYSPSPSIFLSPSLASFGRSPRTSLPSTLISSIYNSRGCWTCSFYLLLSTCPFPSSLLSRPSTLGVLVHLRVASPCYPPPSPLPPGGTKLPPSIFEDTRE